jgi:serine/threonine-protein kinase
MNIGDTLDHYLLEGIISRSAMATLFRATDQRNGSIVAIKLPAPATEADAASADRFQREEEIGKRLNDPCVVRALPGNKRSGHYMVLEWAPGQSLRVILERQKTLEVNRAIRLTLEVLRALDYIHGRAVVHCDLKPENIMVDDQDHIKLIDFGVATYRGVPRLMHDELSRVMGTPDYISPEQARGKTVDARSDLYAAGIILYEMLTGEVPFKGDTPLAIINDRLRKCAVRPRETNPDISPELEDIVRHALEASPGERYASAKEFARDLEDLDQAEDENRSELRGRKHRKGRSTTSMLVYMALLLIPAFIMVLLFAVRRW